MTDGIDYWDENHLVAGTQGINDEAAKWDDLAAQMRGVAEKAKQLNLERGAFRVADPWAGPFVADDQFKIYDDVHQLLCKLFDGAAVEFGQLGNTLRKLAVEYAASDERTYINMKELYKA